MHNSTTPRAPPPPLAPPADTFIQKTKKLYLDTRTQRNIAKLNADIAEVLWQLLGAALKWLCGRPQPRLATAAAVQLQVHRAVGRPESA